MCVFFAVIKPALGNIIRRGGVMYQDDMWKEWIAEVQNDTEV